MFGSDSVFQAGDAGRNESVSTATDQINGKTATHGRGGGGGACDLKAVTAGPNVSVGAGGAGGRGYIFVYVIGGTISNATWS